MIILRGWRKPCALMEDIRYIELWFLLQVVNFPINDMYSKDPFVKLRSGMSLQQLWLRGLSFPTIYFLFDKVQLIHYLIYQVWMLQVDSFITSSFYVNPEEVLQISLNSQDQFGSLEVLYDLVYFLLVRTCEYCVVYVQGVNLFPYVQYAHVHCRMC